MFFQYLDKLDYNRQDLLSCVQELSESLWEYWITPGGKIVRNYKQIYYDQLPSIEIVENILSQINVDTGPTIFMRYEPYSQLPVHCDWKNKSAILIGISDNSNIFFWNKTVPTKVNYDYPILANLEELHSVDNNVDSHRYVLKIPTIEDFNEVYEKLSYLY